MNMEIWILQFKNTKCWMKIMLSITGKVELTKTEVETTLVIMRFKFLKFLLDTK